MPDAEPEITFTTYNTGTATSYFEITWPPPVVVSIYNTGTATQVYEFDMSPGNRAIDMVFEALAEKRIEERVRDGEWPVQVLWDEWGDCDLDRAVRESKLDGDVKETCRVAVDFYLAQRALQAALGGVQTYRNAALDLPEPPKRPPGFWERLGLRLRAWAGRARGPEARR